MPSYLDREPPISAYLREPRTSDRSALKKQDLPFLQQVIRGINKSAILDFKIQESHVTRGSELLKGYEYYNITLTSTRPVERIFFTGSGPIWSAVRSLETMRNAWDHNITDEDIALMFGLSYKGVNVDNEIMRQYEKRVTLEALQERLQNLAQKEA